MSVTNNEIISEVWKHAPVKNGTLLVLLALADRADPTTRTCYPSVKSLANKCRRTERQVQNCIRTMRDMGIIEVRRNGSPLKTNLYKIASSEELAELSKTARVGQA